MLEVGKGGLFAASLLLLPEVIVLQSKVDKVSRMIQIGRALKPIIHQLQSQKPHLVNVLNHFAPLIIPLQAKFLLCL